MMFFVGYVVLSICALHHRLYSISINIWKSWSNSKAIELVETFSFRVCWIFKQNIFKRYSIDKDAIFRICISDIYLFWIIYKNKLYYFKVRFIVLWKKHFNSESSVYVTSYHVVIFVEWLQYTLTHTYIFISWRKGAWRKIVFNVRVTCCCFDYIRKHKIWRIQHSIISELNVDGAFFPVGYRGFQTL